MTVEIESILQHEDVQGLLENAESTGSVRQPDVADLIEAHQLDALETDAIWNELERRGIEITDTTEEPEKEEKRRRSLRLPRSRFRTRRRPTRCSSSSGKPAGTRC
jgi:hypothetical protein